MKPVWNELFQIGLNLPADKLTEKMGIIFRVIDEDVTEHDLVGEAVLVPMKDILSETNKTHNLKLLYKGKPAGDVTVETRFEVGAKAPPE